MSLTVMPHDLQSCVKRQQLESFILHGSRKSKGRSLWLVEAAHAEHRDFVSEALACLKPLALWLLGNLQKA